MITFIPVYLQQGQLVKPNGTAKMGGKSSILAQYTQPKQGTAGALLVAWSHRNVNTYTHLFSFITCLTVTAPCAHSSYFIREL